MDPIQQAATAGGNAGGVVSPRRTNRKTHVRIARNLEEVMMTYMVRATVYMAEQSCPYAEEFDGNDQCATHFLGFVGDEPAGCLRIRFFRDFAKLERLAVRKEYRRSTLAFDMVRDAFEFIRRKGYSRVYGHTREGLGSFWARFGFKPIDGKPNFIFSDYVYTEILANVEPAGDNISIDSGPMVILRPEGDWDRPGILEMSGDRPARTPTDNSVNLKPGPRA